MAVYAHSAPERVAVYAALRRRNRLVGVLRFLVPIGTTALFGILAVQLVEANMGQDFTVGRVSIEQNRLSVEAPSYAGRLEDGSTFSMTSARAEAGLGMPNIIDLTDAQVTLERPDGRVVTATAATAELDTEAQVILVPGRTDITESQGANGEVNGLRIDVVGQLITAEGPLGMRLPDGSILSAANLRYDFASKLWHFEQVSMELPSTPGEETIP